MASAIDRQAQEDSKDTGQWAWLTGRLGFNYISEEDLETLRPLHTLSQKRREGQC